MPVPQATDMANERARAAYNIFRGGFNDTPPLPHWDDAPAWVRDVALVAYLQGHLDGAWTARQSQKE